MAFGEAVSELVSEVIPERREENRMKEREREKEGKRSFSLSLSFLFVGFRFPLAFGDTEQERREEEGTTVNTEFTFHIRTINCLTRLLHSPRFYFKKIPLINYFLLSQ